MSRVSISRQSGDNHILAVTGSGLSTTDSAEVAVPAPVASGVLVVDYMGAPASVTVPVPVATGEIEVT